MRIRWLLLSALCTFFSALPAEAARLINWRFDTHQNRLFLTTDEGVRPAAKLISNPSRVVIDLPGTSLEKPTTHQQVGGAVKTVRAGQFNAQTTRLVVELEAGYTVDPQQVKVVGNNPTQWSVQLPTPKRVASPSRSLPVAANRTPTVSHPNFQITRHGFYVRLDGKEAGHLQVRRSRDRRQIEIDLPNTVLPNSLVGQVLPVNRYGVSQARFDRVSASSSRITLNTTEKGPNWQASFSRLGGLVLIPEGGVYAIASSNPTPENAVTVATIPSPNPSAPAVSIPVPPPLNPLPPRATPPVSRPTPRPAPPPKPQPSPSLPSVRNSRVAVTIDPGHGGRDPGAIGINGLREKDVILPISKEVARLLEKQGVTVQLLRSDDRFISLKGRTDRANRAGTDLFVSIHANSAGKRPSVNGAETFYFSSGRGLAQSIQESMIRRTGLKNRGVKQARFYVLRNSSMPAALVEVGFVTGRSDAAKLSNPSFRNQMAAAITEGILNYIKRNGL